MTRSPWSRRLPTAVATATAVVLLPAVPLGAPAAAAPAPLGASAGAAVLVAGQVAAASTAPAVPGARRFTGRIPAGTRQVIVVKAARWSSTHGRLVRWTRTATGWTKSSSVRARLGYGGIVRADRRRQGTGTTPAGLFRMTESFGRQGDPGTALPYTRLTSDHWWVQDRRSAYYNQMRRGSQGGFARRSSGYNGSEHLLSYGRQYDYVAVIDFNRPRPVIGRGSGIFLHVNGPGLTAGCVSIGRARMRTLLRWLSPAAAPVIAIGPQPWLSTSPR